ncbi:site-specific integrase [Streptobacillus notomytis]|uniref:site-specific integrase n=1 Tax=Streptobacillus notomytis TaxID=1712031 RepID=UPI000937C35B|nr:site-specific integrase [Streptobacillus notomytis]
MKNSNGTGSIYKLPGKRRCPYIIRSGAIKIDNKYKRKIIGSASTLKKALEILQEYNSRLGKLSNEKITLKNLFEKWKDSKHAKSIKTEETLNRYINTFENTFKSLFSLNFAQLKYKDYQPLLDNIPKTNGKVSLTVLKSIYLNAMKNEIIKTDITVLLEASNILTRKVKRVIFKNEFVQYLWIKYNETNESKYAIILILFYTGMRSIDLVRIQNKNINLEERYLITGSKTKAGMNRKVPLHHLIFPLVKKYKNKNIYLFNITSTNNLNKIFSKIIQEYDII